MYYLHSRYYDPEVCRFINADKFASTGQGIIGNNMFAYCNNNPENGVDPSGHWVVGAIVGGVLSGVNETLNGGDFWDVVLATIEGAIVGALSEEEGKLLFLGALIHGGYTAFSTEGDAREKTFKGLASSLSVLFWGKFGSFATSGFKGTSEYDLAKNTISILFGADAVIVDNVIRLSETPDWFTNIWNRIFGEKTPERETAPYSSEWKVRIPNYSPAFYRAEIVLS